MGEVGRVGPMHPLYMSLGVPEGGVSAGSLASCSIAGFRGVLLSRGRSSPLTSLKPPYEPDNHVFHADSSLTY